jgi:hypothetical protein
MTFKLSINLLRIIKYLYFLISLIIILYMLFNRKYIPLTFFILSFILIVIIYEVLKIKLLTHYKDKILKNISDAFEFINDNKTIQQKTIQPAAIENETAETVANENLFYYNRFLPIFDEYNDYNNFNTYNFNNINNDADYMNMRIYELNETLNDIIPIHTTNTQNPPLKLLSINQQPLNYQPLPQPTPTTTPLYRNAILPMNRIKPAYTPIYIRKTHTSDTQNVHDSGVQKDIQLIAEKLNTSTASNNLNTEILDYILQNNDKDIIKIKENAIKTYDTINNTNTYISNIKSHERQILNSVWNRSNDIQNQKNSVLIKNAIVQALSNSIERNIPVCSTGRTTNIISSLATLDYDNTIGTIGSSEMYKNEIIDDAAKIFNKLSNEIPNDDTLLRNKYSEELDKLKIKYPNHFTDKMKTDFMCAI